MALPGNCTITWYGHSCWELRTSAGRTILFDPWFSNPLSPKRADAVETCDLLLVTHGHFDHFGDALMVGSRTRPTWPCIHEMSLWLGRNFAHKDSVIGMNKDEPLGRFLRKIPQAKFEPASGPGTLCGVAVETDDATGLARCIALVRLGGKLEQAAPAFWG